MSAFICNNYHISVLAVEIKRHNIDFSIKGSILSVEQIAEELYKTNLESVNYRYNENIPANFVLDLPVYQCYSFIGIIKAARCYIYQSCEHPGYENSLANKFIQSLIICMIIRLPGYDVVAWELEKPQTYQNTLVNRKILK